MRILIFCSFLWGNCTHCATARQVIQARSAFACGFALFSQQVGAALLVIRFAVLVHLLHGESRYTGYVNFLIAVLGGLFLRNKPLQCMVSVYSNSKNAIAQRRAVFGQSVAAD